jgi:2'-5' RNA ligase
MDNSKENHVRSFIAVEMPEAVKKELSRLQTELKQNCTDSIARWVAPQNIHLTLQFLGDVPQSKIGKIKNALVEVSSAHTAFELRLGELGVFPGINRPRVIWVGLDGNLKRLADIQKQIEQLLSGAGFVPENRPFSSHLTLARVREEASPAEKQKLGQIISSMTFKSGCTIPVRRINLMKSQLTPHGSVYSVLFSADLKTDHP